MVNSLYYIGFENRCLYPSEVYIFFDTLFPNGPLFYSRKLIRIINLIHRERVSLNRIISIEYLIISKYFVITYYKRHKNRIGSIYIKL